MTKYLVKSLAKCKTFTPKCILLGKKHMKDVLYQLLERSNEKHKATSIHIFFLEWVKFKRLTIPNVSENLKQNSHALLIDISKDTIDLAEKKIDILKKVSYTPTI